MKKHYKTPEMDIVNFDCEDVITTSGLDHVEGVGEDEIPGIGL